MHPHNQTSWALCASTVQAQARVFLINLASFKDQATNDHRSSTCSIRKGPPPTAKNAPILLTCCGCHTWQSAGSIGSRISWNRAGTIKDRKSLCLLPGYLSSERIQYLRKNGTCFDSLALCPLRQRANEDGNASLVLHSGFRLWKFCYPLQVLVLKCVFEILSSSTEIKDLLRTRLWSVLDRRTTYVLSVSSTTTQRSIGGILKRDHRNMQTTSLCEFPYLQQERLGKGDHP